MSVLGGRGLGGVPRAARTPNERALDEQHDLIAALERAAELYGRRKGDTRPSQQLRRILRFERERLRLLRSRVDRERARPGG